MNVGDKVKVINPQSELIGLTGEIVFSYYLNQIHGVKMSGIEFINVDVLSFFSDEIQVMQDQNKECSK